MKKLLLLTTLLLMYSVTFSQISITETHTNVTCFGGNNSTINISPSGGIAPYTYTLTTPMQTNGTGVFSGIPAGTYSVIVSDAIATTNSIVVIITEPTAITPSLTSTSALCFGTATGTINVVSVTGGFTPYQYSFNGGPFQASSTFANVPAGIYVVGARDVNGCVGTQTIQVTEPTVFTAAISAFNNVSCFGLVNGSATAFPIGGIGGPYTYSWTPSGQTAATATNLAPGTYTVAITNFGGCVATATVNILQPPQISSTITASNVVCFGTSTGVLSALGTGGTPPYTYLWPAISSTLANVGNVAVGTYTVIVTDANNCSTANSIVVTQPTQMNVSITHTNVSCAGICDGKTNATTSGGTPPYVSWVWNIPTSQALPNITNVCPGNWMVNVTDINGCTATQSVTITQPPLLTAVTSATNSNCGQANGSVCATVTGGTGVTSYLWSTGNTLLCNSNVTAGAYTFTVTDANGCMANASGLVNDVAGPTVSITSQTHVTCFNGTNGGATSSVTGGIAPYIYSWGPFGGSTPSITGVTAGLYNLTVTDNAGCVGTVSIQISQPTQLNIAMSFTNASCGMCNGQAYAIAGGGNPVYMYTWSPSIGNTSMMNGLCAGNYTLQITDVNGCTKTSTVAIASAGAGALAGVTTTLTPIDETCSNSSDGSVDLTLGGSNPGPFTYQWSNGGSGQDIFNIPAGSYDVTIYDSGMNCLILSSNVGVVGTNCGSISGHVFIDNNADCVNNSGDSDFQSAMVIANPGNRYGYTDALGNYTINNLMYGTYTVSLNGGSNLYVPTCTASIISTVNSGAPNSLNTDFSGGFNSTTQPDMRVYAGSNNIAPGFLCNSYYYLNNMNNVNGTGLLKVTLPSSFIANISNVTPGSYSISGDTVIWNFSNMVYSSGSNSYSIEFVVPLSTPLGSTFTTCIYADPNTTDFDYTNNSDCYSRIVTGSFDPNDKTVSPVGVGLNGDIAATVTDLSYLIRFQNTGNGPAVNIVVKDTLSPNVDVNTFEMLGSSHNYNIDILPGNILRWKFNNIMLADSGSNEPASHGYIHYRIKRTGNNTPGTQIKNTAYIYFDFNAPVITNTAINTIETVTGIQSLNTANDQWLVYPNPSSGVLNLINNNIAADTKLKIEVVNSFGQVVYEEIATANHKTLDLSKFSNGVYFVKIISDKQSSIKRVVLSR